MQKTNFSAIQLTLLDPTPRGVQQRAEISNILNIGKSASACTTIGCALTGIFGLVLAPTYPVIGGALLISGITGGLISRDVYVITQNGANILNGENLLSGKDLVSKLADQASCRLTSKWFVNKLFKETYIMAPIFSEVCIQILDQKQRN
jgi:hypothetical protein